MNKIPPEVDRLMWAVAENPKVEAMDEFAERYPSYRAELLKRIEMVKGLRHEVNAVGVPRHSIPKFEPRPPGPSGSPVGTYVAGGLGLIAICFAAYTVVVSLRKTPVTPVPSSLVRNTIERPIEEPKVVYRQDPPPTYTPAPAYVPPPVKQENVDFVEKPRDLDLKDVQITDALSLITAGSNLKLEIGPGFVNQKITISFHQRTTTEMLKELAKEYAFTVSDEGDGHFLVLPVPDDAASSVTSGVANRRVGP